ncbi:VOC family protein [Mucilaginibacter ginkgonis]|uniref:VOC family protein n=1 Tax=Mucilaginibacter ginkgonis TaxID=2682091 RepID=A0A6I4I2U1_9SPHI|nr:VOC family protein [Mucilaginibacter ginkgonis]QQL49067.1 VOC family protein [Mucilaginibacter ginkgonis]
MKKVTGIGGIFFKCDDPQQMNDWYAKNLGLPVQKWGTMFRWRDAENPDKEGTTVWSTFKRDAQSFEPSAKEFMINYRVDDLEALVKELKAAGVTFVDEMLSDEYGKFVHIMDPEGNKIELWEDLG